MSLSTIVQMAGYLLLALAGIVLFAVGAYGSVRVRLLRFERAFTWKERFQLTIFGLLLIAFAFTSLAGVAGSG